MAFWPGSSCRIFGVVSLRHLLEDRAWDSSHASSSNHKFTSYSKSAARVGKTLAVLVVLGPCPAHGLRCLVNEAEVDPRHVREPQHRAAASDFCGVCLFAIPSQALLLGATANFKWIATRRREYLQRRLDRPPLTETLKESKLGSLAAARPTRDRSTLVIAPLGRFFIGP